MRAVLAAGITDPAVTAVTVRRYDELVAYADRAYAREYLDLVARVDDSGMGSEVTDAVARYLHAADGLQGRVRGGPADRRPGVRRDRRPHLRPRRIDGGAAASTDPSGRRRRPQSRLPGAGRVRRCPDWPG